VLTLEGEAETIVTAKDRTPSVWEMSDHNHQLYVVVWCLNFCFRFYMIKAFLYQLIFQLKQIFLDNFKNTSLVNLAISMLNSQNIDFKI